MPEAGASHHPIMGVEGVCSHKHTPASCWDKAGLSGDSKLLRFNS